MRTETLTAQKGGINRQKIKGGASKEWLYDLHQGYIDASHVPRSRPGTVTDADLPEGTRGLCAFNSQLVVFAIENKTIANPMYACEVVIHPTDATQAIAEIHFAGPFLGYLYVVAEFANGDVFHYWLQRRDAWSATTVYNDGDVVEPTVRNGYAYRAKRIGTPAIPWAPNVARALADKVEPTTPNGYEYTVIAVLGSAPKSGTTEPAWPANDGATVIEETDLTLPTAPTDPSPPSGLPPSIIERYGTWGAFGRLALQGSQQ